MHDELLDLAFGMTEFFQAVPRLLWLLLRLVFKIFVEFPRAGEPPLSRAFAFLINPGAYVSKLRGTQGAVSTKHRESAYRPIDRPGFSPPPAAGENAGAGSPGDH